MDFWKCLCLNQSNSALSITLHFSAFISLNSGEMFPFHTEVLISLALWSSTQKVLRPNLLQWPHKVRQDLKHLWTVLSVLLLKVLSVLSPVFLSPTLHIFSTHNITQPPTLSAELNWNHVDFYSAIVAVQQKLRTQHTSPDLDFACHLMFITSFSNRDIMNLTKCVTIASNTNYNNICTAFLCIIYTSKFSSEMLHNNMHYYMTTFVWYMNNLGGKTCLVKICKWENHT